MHLFIKHVLPFRSNHQGESHVEAKGNENERHEGNRGRRSALREPSFPMRKGTFRRRSGETPQQDPDQTFKTLVTVAKSGEHYVFMVPVAEELDLKKAAAAVGEKAVSMLKSKELLPLTGYVHGGCSPVGMKKLFTTTIDETAQLFDTIIFSGGRIGCQVELAPSDLEKVIPLHYADITVS